MSDKTSAQEAPCKHPPARHYALHYIDPFTGKSVLWIGCAACGQELYDGASKQLQEARK